MFGIQFYFEAVNDMDKAVLAFALGPIPGFNVLLIASIQFRETRLDVFVSKRLSHFFWFLSLVHASTRTYLVVNKIDENLLMASVFIPPSIFLVYELVSL